LQRALLPLLHYSLRPGGLLLLGSSETVGKAGRLFAPIESKLRFYLRQDVESTAGADMLMRPLPPLATTAKEPPVPYADTPAQKANRSLQAAADHLLLQQHSPPAVVLNSDGDIV